MMAAKDAAGAKEETGQPTIVTLVITQEAQAPNAEKPKPTLEIKTEDIHLLHAETPSKTALHRQEETGEAAETTEALQVDQAAIIRANHHHHEVAVANTRATMAVQAIEIVPNPKVVDRLPGPRMVVPLLQAHLQVVVHHLPWMEAEEIVV